MNSNEFRALVTEHLLPMFCGAELDGKDYPSTQRHYLVAYKDPCSIWLKPRKDDTYRLIMRRSQPFDPKRSEMDVAKVFIKVLSTIAAGLGAPYRNDLLAALARRIVAEFLDSKQHEVILKVIDRMTLWSSQTYEGKPISAAIGFDQTGGTGGPLIEDVCELDLSRVVSDGMDTLLVCSPSGQVLSHEALSPATVGTSSSPYCFRAVADWAGTARIAIVLTRNGEILAFKNKRLLFAKRRGAWHFLAHEPILKRMARPDSKAVRQAVYESCLDVSFAKCGCCLAIATSGNKHHVGHYVVKGDDWVGRNGSIKSLFLGQAIKNRKFQDLPRVIRQELLGIDGATVLDHEGHVLAVGAIVKIARGSTSGGRKAAAIALSSLGLGIKVSADGGIIGFLGRPGKIDPTEAFRICEDAHE